MDDTFKGMLFIAGTITAFFLIFWSFVLLIPAAGIVVGYLVWKNNPSRIEAEKNRLHDEMYARATKLFSPQSLNDKIDHNVPGFLDVSIREQFHAIGADILRDEGITEEVPKPPITASGIEGARWRDKIASLDRNPRVIEDIAMFFNRVGLKCPTEEGELSVPLSHFINYDEAYDLGLHLDSFVAHANTFEKKDSKEDIVITSNVDQIMDVEVPFAISDKTRNEHLWLLGATGTGKTTTMKYLISKDLPHVWEGDRSVIVIESKGDLFNAMLDIKYDEPDKVALLNVEDIEYPLCLNLFEIGKNRIDGYSALEKERLTNSIIELYEYVLSSLMDASMTSKQSVVFRYITRLMLLIPGATLDTMRVLLEEGGSQKYQKYIDKLEGTPKYFFETEFDDRQFVTTRKEVLRRLYGVLENQTFARMFSNPENKFDLFDEMNKGRLILIYASKTLLKDDASRMFVRFIVAMLTQAIQERSTIPEHKRIRTHVYIDEAHEFLDQNTETILAQARAFNVGLTVANQYISQLSPQLQAAFFANTNTKMVGYASVPDAKKLAPQLHCDHETLSDLQKGEFAVWQKGSIPRAVPVQFPPYPFAILDEADDFDKDYLRDVSREKYATAPEPEPVEGDGFTMQNSNDEPEVEIKPNTALDPDNVEESGEW